MKNIMFYRCFCCEHDWSPKRNYHPKCCPHCRTKHWRGPQSVHRVDPALKVGDTQIMRWPWPGQVYIVFYNIAKYEKETGMKFSIKQNTKDAEITRIY